MTQYVLIDFRHLCYKARNLPKLTITTTIGNQQRVIDTTIASFVVKDIYYKSGRASYPTAVFLEGGREGIPTFRKEYFQRLVNEGTDLTKGYKEGRKGESHAFYHAVNTAEELIKHGISVYRVERLEADDLIAAMVRKIKYHMGDTTTPIVILTNDNDMLPLVDDQVSVYIRSPRTYAEPGCIEYKGYYQVTPRTWYDYLEGTSEYGEFYIPYNSMLLYKLIRGDSADAYKGACKGLGKVSYSNLMRQMEQAGVDFENIFRYGNDFDTIMRPVLEQWFKEEEVERMHTLYKGIDMIQSHNGVDYLHEKLRAPLQIDLGVLQKASDALNIRVSR